MLLTACDPQARRRILLACASRLRQAGPRGHWPAQVRAVGRNPGWPGCQWPVSVWLVLRSLAGCRDSHPRAHAATPGAFRPSVGPESRMLGPNHHRAQRVCRARHTAHIAGRVPTRADPDWNHFRYSSPIVTSGRPAALPTATGWDEELRARNDGIRLPRPGRSESSLRTDPSVCPITLRRRYR